MTGGTVTSNETFGQYLVAQRWGRRGHRTFNQSGGTVNVSRRKLSGRALAEARAPITCLATAPDWQRWAHICTTVVVGDSIGGVGVLLFRQRQFCFDRRNGRRRMVGNDGGVGKSHRTAPARMLS